MNIELREFQQTSVDKFVRELRKAARDAAEGDLQAVLLASPTGSGKTVMLIEAIERILEGDEQKPPQPDATFLWITDQPELNVQTRDKMLAFSTVLDLFTLTILDAEFDEPQLAPGYVYFLNTQKLGKNSSMVAEGDRRQWVLWKTLEKTVRERPGRFYVIIDEAHRGMVQSRQAINEANSIIQKFILGASDEIPPVPLIVGISATPQRFNALLQAAQSGLSSRIIRQVTVAPADVRESGLIKEAIQFVHPTETQPSDMTLLRAAVTSWQVYESRWATYCAEQHEPPVRPLLAVQVADATASAISGTDLAEALGCIEDAAGILPPAAFAHAFQDHGDLEVAGRRIRYLPPSEIAADPEARVVFFKTSLTTGWDCPRAEVMMSFRTAADATLIAQLVGRMVRTPLVRRVESDEHLNTVALYLPHYDQAGLEQVVRKLTDGELSPPTELRTEPSVSLSRAENSAAWFALLEVLPSYHVPRAPKPNEAKRLLRLALRLSNDGLYPDAWDKARDLLLGIIDAAYERCHDTRAFRQIVDERNTLDIRLVSYLYGEDEVQASAAQQIAVSPENIEDLFEAAGRKIGEGLHRDWRTRRVENDDIDPRRAKLELVALATADLKRDLDRAAAAQTQTWMTLYGLKIKALPEKKRQEYDKVQDLAAAPEVVTLSFPNTIDAKAKGTPWQKHLYADAQGLFHAEWADRVDYHRK